MPDLTPEDRDRLRELASGATPGPWEANGSLIGVGRAGSNFGQTWGLRWRQDIEFIAAARTAVPALLDMLEKAEAERDKYIHLIGVLAEQVAAREANQERVRAALDRVRAHLIRWADEYGDEVYQGNGWAEGVRDAAREALKELDGQR